MKETFSHISRIFEEEVPFNRVLGLKILELDSDHARTGFDMKPELIGNYVRRSLHGGVVSSVLDATGGLLALAGYAQTSNASHKAANGSMTTESERQLAQTGTVDLRVDYLLPGRGAWFSAEARILRRGKRLVVCRMNLENDEEQLLATATGVYSVGAEMGP